MGTKKSFSARLSMNIILLTSVLFIVTVGVASYSSHSILAEEAQTSSERMLKIIIRDVEKQLGSVESSVQSIAWLVEENKTDKKYLYHIVTKIVSENENVVGSTIAFAPEYFKDEHYFSPYAYEDSDGTVRTKQLGNKQYDYFSMEWYKDSAESGRPHWSEPYFDDGGGEMLMSTYSYPLKDSDGKVYAIITADISLIWIQTMLAGVQPYPSSRVILVSKKGECINASQYGRKTYNFYEWTDSLGDKNVSEFARGMASGQSGMGQFANGWELSFAIYDGLENGWSAAIMCNYKDVLSRTSKLHFVLILIGLIGLTILFIICYFIIRKQTRPLTEFTQSAISIAKGNFQTELPEIKTEDEIKQLRDSFDYMQHSLIGYINDLKTTTQQNERLESELNIASKIQQGMLPNDFPHTDTTDLFAMLKPAKEVGGDLYDFYIKNDYLYFAIGDVSGKGIPASMFMAITRAAFRFISTLESDMSQLMNKLNNSLSEGNSTGMFVTMFTGRINLKTGVMDYCNGGHNPIVIVPPGKEPYYLKSKSNLALGVMEGFGYEAESITLEKGTELLLYTDGVTEAERADKAQYGEDRLLCQVGAQTSGESAEDECRGIMDDIHAFTDGNEQNDDITIMTIKIK